MEKKTIMSPPTPTTPDIDLRTCTSWVQRIEQSLTWPFLITAWVILFQLLALIYGPAIRSPFLYDDFPNIVQNEDFRADDPIRAILSGHRSSLQFDRRPVGAVLSWINFATAGLDVQWFRLTNLVLHWLCAMALYFASLPLARQWLIAPRLFALVLAFLWAVHPLHSTAVVYISQRMESLMTLFWLLSAGCMMRAHPGGSGAKFYLSAAWLCAVLCLLSKENGAGIPIILLIIDRYALSGSWAVVWRHHKVFHILLLIGLIPYLAWVLSGPRVDEWDDVPDLANPWRYFQTQCFVVFNYFRQVFWPSNLVFAPVPRVAETWASWIPHFTALVALFGFLVIAAKQRTWIWIPLLSILLVLAPTSSFFPVPLEPSFDYRMHLPAAGVLSLALAGCLCMARRFLFNPIFLLLAVIVCLGAAAGAARFRAEVYAKSETIWLDTVLKEPENVKAWFNLASVLLAQDRLEEARFAVESAHRANVAFQLPWIESQYQRLSGLIAEKTTNWEEAESRYRQAIAIFPESPEARIDLARTLIHQDRAAEALEQLESPPLTGSGLLEAFLWRALSLAELGRLEEATQVAVPVEQARALGSELETARSRLREILHPSALQTPETSINR